MSNMQEKKANRREREEKISRLFILSCAFDRASDIYSVFKLLFATYKQEV